MFSKTPGQFSKTPGQFSNSKTPGQFSTTGCSTAFSEERPVRMRLLQLEEEEENIPPMPLTMEVKTEPVDFAAEAEPAAQVAAKIEVKTETIERDIAALDLNLQEIDPFCSQLQRKLLSTLPTPFDARPGFSQSSIPLPTFRVNQCVSMGNSVATLKRSLGEGAYAKIYLAVMEPEGKLVVLKYAPEDTTCWDFYISSEIRSRLTDPCMVKKISHISNAYLHDNGVIYQMDFISKATLLDVINNYRQVNQEVPPNVVIYLTLQILKLVQALHKVQIIHADLKPDNFLIIPSKDQYFASLHLIDFGRCIDMSLLPTGSSFRTTFKCADSRCIEMRTNRPWTYQLDFYGVAATIHCLLFGKYMNVKEVRGRWMPTCKPKRFWEQTPLYEKLFETLLNVESCDKQPDLQPFITSLQQVVKSIKAIILSKELKTVFSSKNDN
ncbi:hypothetical protein B566_EDAN001963 [Ephemera danica]|nr:hypothetical protein B566_EDAN001963 [Ephemera danica]